MGGRWFWDHQGVTTDDSGEIHPGTQLEDDPYSGTDRVGGAESASWVNRAGRPRNVGLTAAAVVLLVLGGLVGWAVRGGPASGPVVMLGYGGTSANTAVLEISHSGVYDAEWSGPLGSGAAVAVPRLLACYVTFGQGDVIQSAPTGFVEFRVRQVLRPVVVALTIVPGGSTSSNPFVIEISRNETVGGTSRYFDSNGFSIRPSQGC